MRTFFGDDWREMKSKEGVGPKQGTPGPRLGMAKVLAAIALGLSGFLLYGSLAGDSLPGCGAESGCNTVLGSRWSKWFGIPVSMPAMLLYAMVLAAMGMISGKPQPLVRGRLWSFLAMAAAALIGAALWFIGLQLFVIKAICPFCMTAHACGLVVGTLLLARVPWRENEDTRRGPANPKPTLRHRVQFALAGLMAVAALALGQVLYQPPTYDVQGMTVDTPRSSVTGSNSPAASQAIPPSTPAAGAAAEAAKPKPPRVIGLHGDLFQLNLDELPTIGSPDAPHVIVHFFDYSCSHCRVLHPILLKAVRELTNQLAIVSLHLPLNSNCNRMIKMQLRDHTNACAYARDGLALWRANPSKLHEFDDWIFAPPRPPAPAETRAEAMRLAGSNEFVKALSDPWITNRLEQNIRIFETNYARYKRSALPQLMIGTNIVTGNFRSVDDLYKLLAAQFPISLPVRTTNAIGASNATNSSARSRATNTGATATTPQ
jgi:uncharacterized membrane protein